VKKTAVQFKWLIVSIVSIILSWGFYNLFYNTDIDNEKEQFQKSINSLRNKQQLFLQEAQEVIATSTIQQLWENEAFSKTSFNVNVFFNDSLVYWNNNEVPLSGLIDTISTKSFPQLISLSNGFYLADVINIHDETLIISSKIKHNYYYENESLRNTLTKGLSLPDDIEIYTSKVEFSSPVYGENGTPLFYIAFNNNKLITDSQQILIFLLYALGVLSLIIAFAKFLILYSRKRPWVFIAFPVVFIALRYFSVQFGWIQLFTEFEIFNPNLYASSELFPSLGSLIISIGCLLILFWWFYDHISLSKSYLTNGPVLIALYLLVFPLSYFISWIFESLVLNSTISLVIDEVFSLNIYSFVALLLIASLFFGYYLLALATTRKIVKTSLKLNTIALFWFLTGCIYFFAEIFFFQKNIYNALWPILLNGLLFFIVSKKRNQNALKYQLVLLVVISFYAAFILFESNQSNEHQKRELYANQLVTDQNPTTEIEYLSTIHELKINPTFLKMLDAPKAYNSQAFIEEIEECCFNGFWERYEMSFFFFDSLQEPLIEYTSNQSKTYNEVKKVIDDHGVASSIANHMYYIEDYHDRLSYVVKETIQSKQGNNVELYILFRSKKIPEQIGFPRLLMNEKTYALDDLEDYSIARYSEGDLVMRFGSYNYATKQSVFTNNHGLNRGFVTANNVSHYIYQEESGQTVIISKPEKQIIEKMTTFSYLFLFFGLFTLVVLVIVKRDMIFPFKSLQLSLKIQLVLIGIVVFAFVVFAFVAGNYTQKQYSTYTFENLKEKASSVETEVSQKLGDKEELDVDVLGNYMMYILKKFSTVFVTDINLYDLDGKLLASSQPKLYDKGISAKHMNPAAFKEMALNKKSEYIHQESIGELEYLSAYLPFINNNGKLLGYLNLQHFAKQNAYENQVNDFIVAIINIAVLLLVFTVVIAIFVASWITTPLRLIQESFKNVELGKQNQPIAYKGNDEIGALVKDYNDKLAELELKAMQLARSERETAWREMAKQVAHEIKNPLTPMRLSLQHFQRSFDPNSEKAQEKINKIANSLVEQIDTLTKIANEFSNFAKMPKANEQRLDLIPMIENAINLYQSDDVDIFLETSLEEVIVFVDKDLMLRVFNNLIKNAIQATLEGEKPVIKIMVEEDGKNFLIRVQDNGAGISEEAKGKIFVPNFTTKTTGAGLGLAMVKQIVQNHNGEIWFETEEGKGTTFYVFVPRYKE
jgi:two-component system nitrogen regulation sensor histidine kinase NtrY